MTILTVLLSLLGVLGLLVPWFSGNSAYRAVAVHGRGGE